MNRVFVLSSSQKPLMPCHPARARKLLSNGRASVFRYQPFTIIINDRKDGNSQQLEFKVDPGSKTTGIALVANFSRGKEVVWAANLTHRGYLITTGLTGRRLSRSDRRDRKCRYREQRYSNRSRVKGWLPPSLMSRVYNVKTWYTRILRYSPISEVAVESVSFDTQAMQTPDISGVEYQRGELAGYEVRGYVLHRGKHKCAYCGAVGVPLEIEHVYPKSKGGSDRVSNLVPACRPCNQKKGSKPVEIFLKGQPSVLAKIRTQLRSPLKDAAAVNATRNAIAKVLQEDGLPTSFWSGGRTKMNRVHQGYKKDHWIDAACVGTTGSDVHIPKYMTPLLIKSVGRGTRRMCNVNKYGFPRGKPKAVKRVEGFQAGDLAKLICEKGKAIGIHVGRIVGVRKNGWFVLNGHDRPAREFRLLQRADGYEYSTA